MVDEFDVSKYFLGKLCIREHDWNGSGKSLRRLINRNCVECAKISKAKYNRSEHGQLANKKYRQTPKRKEYEARYRKSDARKAVVKRYEQSEKGKATRDRAYAKYMQTPKGKAKVARSIMRIRAWRSTPEGREIHQRRAREYRLNNLDERKAYYKRWRSSEQGREIRRLNQRKREYQQRSSHSSYYTRSELQEHLSRFGEQCAYCGVRPQETIDHFIPIVEGGSDCLSNLVPACIHCNSTKHKSDPLKWYKSQSFYSEKRWREILRLLGKSEDNYNQIPLL